MPQNIKPVRCHSCGDSGAVLWTQKTADGRTVEVAYRCVCNSASKHPNLAPSQGPPEGYYVAREDEN